jgi:acyl-CoA synthetase (AMP-forming)/AMP-acid ligase II
MIIAQMPDTEKMFEGSWQWPADTPRVSNNLRFHPGDLGMFDVDGFFFLDRKKDYLRRRGENVSSIEVEDVFVKHRDIVEVAVHVVYLEFRHELHKSLRSIASTSIYSESTAALRPPETATRRTCHSRGADKQRIQHGRRQSRMIDVPWPEFEPIIENARRSTPLEELPLDTMRHAMGKVLIRWAGLGIFGCTTRTSIGPGGRRPDHS